MFRNMFQVGTIDADPNTGSLVRIRSSPLYLHRYVWMDECMYACICTYAYKLVDELTKCVCADICIYIHMQKMPPQAPSWVHSPLCFMLHYPMAQCGNPGNCLCASLTTFTTLCNHRQICPQAYQTACAHVPPGCTIHRIWVQRPSPRWRSGLSDFFVGSPAWRGLVLRTDLTPLFWDISNGVCP